MPTVRIVVADDHLILRDGLRRLLEAEPGFEVVGESGDVSQTIRLVRTLEPDVLLLDLALPDGSGLDVLKALQDPPSRTRVVLLTAGADKQQIIDSLMLGAQGMVLKESATALLFRCINSVMAGEYWLGHDHLPDLVETLRRLGGPQTVTPAETLTAREMSIVAAVVSGATNREISEQLSISEQTVKNHMSNIFDKVGVSNRLELALFAIHHKLLERQRRVFGPDASDPGLVGSRAGGGPGAARRG